MMCLRDKPTEPRLTLYGLRGCPQYTASNHVYTLDYPYLIYSLEYGRGEFRRTK